ncbi:MAG: hypothetical protein AUJ06_02275 [Chloroflexi bacterium 13_1_40CM_3_70_6]|nr:MAG: hypothetical protein AUJ06_02275 [Chloroflexi bacterium 13_1_40CM_3_70_6]
MPLRERTTRASGANCAIATRRRVVAAASRDANAIARYSVGPLVPLPPLTTKKTSLPGGLSCWTGV